MTFLPTLLAATPFVLFLVLLFWRKAKLIWVSLISLALAGVLAGFYWKMYPGFIFSSFAKGFFVAFDILLIVFGAIFFLGVLRQVKVIENACIYLESISKDLRVQVILLAWFFENFLEGTAGFGTPSTIVAPLLVGLGITPISAVVIALLGNSSAGVFGAAGTPIKAGFAGLFGASLPLRAALINCVGIIVPVFMLWFLTRNRRESKKEFWEMVPFALWAGIAFALPSIAAVFLGIEFPSILGSIAGLILVLLTTKLGIFIPKTEKEMFDQPRRPTLPLAKVIFPYATLVFLLVLGKFVLGSKGVSIPLGINHTFAFFNPGFALFISGLFSAFYFKTSIKEFFRGIASSFETSLAPFLIIVCMSAFAQIMVNSSRNTSELPSMVSYLAAFFENKFLPLWAPLIGTFGSFLTGSVTVSNLMFGGFLATAARQLSFNVDKILALTVVGGALGNMIALADILVAETVVGLKHKERDVVKAVIIPCLFCVLLVGLIGIST